MNAGPRVGPASSEVDHVSCETVDGLLQRLAQSRVRVDVARELVDREVPLLGQGQLGQQLRDVGADEVAADELTVVLSAMSLTKPLGSPRPCALPLAVNGKVATFTS